MLITQYAAGMFSNRITIKDEKNLKGQKFSKYTTNYGHINQVPLNGMITLNSDINTFGPINLPSALLKNEDISFSGAQMEYIWGGKKVNWKTRKVFFLQCL